MFFKVLLLSLYFSALSAKELTAALAKHLRIKIVTNVVTEDKELIDLHFTKKMSGNFIFTRTCLKKDFTAVANDEVGVFKNLVRFSDSSLLQLFQVRISIPTCQPIPYLSFRGVDLKPSSLKAHSEKTYFPMHLH